MNLKNNYNLMFLLVICISFLFIECSSMYTMKLYEDKFDKNNLATIVNPPSESTTMNIFEYSQMFAVELKISSVDGKKIPGYIKSISVPSGSHKIVCKIKSFTPKRDYREYYGPEKDFVINCEIEKGCKYRPFYHEVSSGFSHSSYFNEAGEIQTESGPNVEGIEILLMQHHDYIGYKTIVAVSE